MVNTLGVDSDEWCEDRPPNPLDSMPIANGKNRYHPNPDFEPEPPRPEEEIADWFNNTEIENPDELPEGLKPAEGIFDKYQDLKSRQSSVTKRVP